MSFPKEGRIIWQPFSYCTLFILILGHSFPTESFRICLPLPRLGPTACNVHVFFCEYQPKVPAPDWHSQIKTLEFWNDPPLGIEPSDKSKAVVILKTELYTWQSLQLAHLRCVLQVMGSGMLHSEMRVIGFKFSCQLIFFYCSLKKIVAHYWAPGAF